MVPMAGLPTISSSVKPKNCCANSFIHVTRPSMSRFRMITLLASTMLLHLMLPSSSSSSKRFRLSMLRMLNTDVWTAPSPSNRYFPLVSTHVYVPSLRSSRYSSVTPSLRAMASSASFLTFATSSGCMNSKTLRPMTSSGAYPAAGINDGLT